MTVKPFIVYMVECADGSFYTGCAVDVDQRFAKHVSGKGARYTRSHRPLRIVYREQLPEKGAALRREYAIKRMTHLQKQDLIKGGGRHLGAAQLSDRRHDEGDSLPCADTDRQS
ncbi:MAG: GIY-YIG nuclease family protein [Sporolactobacillus sp.]